MLRRERTHAGEFIDPVPFVEAWIELALVIGRCGRASGRGYDGKIRAGARYKNIKVIFLSAMNTVADDAKRVGADGRLAKPYETDDLLEMVRENLDESA